MSPRNSYLVAAAADSPGFAGTAGRPRYSEKNSSPADLFLGLELLGYTNSGSPAKAASARSAGIY
jgi:hypothetical protein